MNRRGIRLGKMHGVEVVLDPSWFIFGILITWLLGSQFAANYARLQGPGAYLLGAMGAVLFLASVLAHELSHAVVAQRKAIPVQRITLYVFGGLAQISKEPATPGDEARIALAGPAMSLGLAALFAGLGLLARGAGLVAPQALFFTLGFVNALLGVFNMLPGFPLDGGRVLRAILWRTTGNFTRATKLAAGSGRGIGIAMMGVGGLVTVSGDPVDGIWLALIGIFLHSMALAAYRNAAATQVPQVPPVPVGELMTRQPQWVAAYLRLDDYLAERLAASPDRAFPVVGPDGMIAGVVTAEAVQSVPRQHWESVTVGNVMVPMHAALAATPQEPVGQVLARLPMNPIGRFVVLDGGRLVGMLTPAALSPAALGLPLTPPAGPGPFLPGQPTPGPTPGQPGPGQPTPAGPGR